MLTSARTRLALVRIAACLASVAALAAGDPAEAAAAGAPAIPPATGKTVRIAVVEVHGRLEFVGPEAVAAGDSLEIVNRTNPRMVGPVTFSLVRPGYLPKTRRARDNCFTPGRICWAIAEWQGVHGDGMPTVNPAEAGAEGWDAEGTVSSAGDSWFSGLAPGGRFAQEVTARSGTRLWFMDAIHPWLRRSIKVI